MSNLAITKLKSYILNIYITKKRPDFFATRALLFFNFMDRINIIGGVSK